MNLRFICSVFLIALYLTFFLLPSSAFGSADSIQSLDGLVDKVKRNQKASLKIYKERENRFLADKNQQQSLFKKAEQDYEKAQQLNNPLVLEHQAKAEKIEALRSQLNQLKQDLGNLDQRYMQFAGDFVTQMQSSLVSSEVRSRQANLQELLEQEQLTDLDQLRQLWLFILEEMQQASLVSQYDSLIVLSDGRQETKAITRIGSFIALFENDAGQAEYLKLNQVSSNTDAALSSLGQLPFRYQQAANASLALLNDSSSGSFVIDPSRGILLGVLEQSPSWFDRVLQGKEVGFMIIALAAIGLVHGLIRMILLIITKFKIKSQLNNLQQASSSNPLGRLLIAAESKPLDENLQVFLDEAILKELPKLESGLKFIKLLAAVAPLLGLLGTVIGMIATFQSISLFGSGDPKLMASGISQALVTTVLGLLAAIPLLFIHNVLQSLSQSLVQLLDEQAAALLVKQRNESLT